MLRLVAGGTSPAHRGRHVITDVNQGQAFSKYENIKKFVQAFLSDPGLPGVAGWNKIPSLPERFLSSVRRDPFLEKVLLLLWKASQRAGTFVVCFGIWGIMG